MNVYLRTSVAPRAAGERHANPPGAPARRAGRREESLPLSWTPLSTVACALPEGVTAPRMARAYLRNVVPPYQRDLVDTSELLASELVTNAVLHGSAPALIHGFSRYRALRVEVHDTSSALPPDHGQTFSLTAESGRGLLLLAALATLWGVQTLHPSPGKTVWFELHQG